MSSTKFSERALSGLVRHGSRLIGSGARFVQLDEEDLFGEAQRQTGLADYGEGELHEGFGRLLRSWNGESGLTLLGRIAARQDALRLLVNRLRMQDDLRHHAAIGAEAIREPIFITGLPRTGTTLLHGLLAQDPAHRAPLNWEVMFPSPPPLKTTYARDRRIEIAARQIRWFHRLAPEFRKIHPIAAKLPEECLIITSHSFASFQFQTSHSVPSYQSWLEAHDLRGSYAAHRRVLQQLQWSGPRGRWVLKAPAHLYGFEALFAVYPDATVILTHRDPLEVVPSMANLHSELRGIFSDSVDAHAVGREVTCRWAEGIRRALHARDAGIAPPERFIDVQYRDLVRDPFSTLRDVYHRLGRELTAPVEARMRGFLAENRKDKHGPHRYSLAQFGFDADEERQRYAAYTRRFGL